MMLLSAGRVDFLVVLYSINVFITFTLSQLGMVRHWWPPKKASTHRLKKLFVNGLGLVMCTAILALITAIKFREGGAITVVAHRRPRRRRPPDPPPLRLHRPTPPPPRRPSPVPPPPKPACPTSDKSIARAAIATRAPRPP